MDWQQAASLLIVAVTLVLLIRGWLRPRRTGTLDCCGECEKLETLSRKGYHEENALNNRGKTEWTPKKP
ncbi:MAG: hypothetical protein H6Q30_1146 [Bacteroidetes bacterium]|nr:hypothetical protein [Bacteroidota bacterium]